MRSPSNSLLTRAHKKAVSSVPPLIAHVLAVPLAYLAGSLFAVAATIALFARAACGLTHDVPRAKAIGWREVAWGAVTVVLFARRHCTVHSAQVHSTHFAMKRFVSCDAGSARLLAQTMYWPSGLNIGKPSKPWAVVTRSGSPPSFEIR